MSVSLNVQQKAQRITEGNRVVMLASYRAVVIGDTATYDVTRFGNRWTCNCAWGMRRGKPCSHVLAVQAATPTNQAPVAALAAVITDRADIILTTIPASAIEE